MPISASDLLSPTGDLVSSLFPGEDAGALATRLDAYITEGQNKTVAITDATVRDRAILHYAYYLAYKAVHVRMAAIPSTAALGGDLSRTFTSAQITAFEKLRDQHFAAYNELFPSAPVSGAARPSSATVMEFGW